MYKYSNLLLQTLSSSQQVHPKLHQTLQLSKQASPLLDLIIAPSRLSTLAVTVLQVANLLTFLKTCLPILLLKIRVIKLNIRLAILGHTNPIPTQARSSRNHSETSSDKINRQFSALPPITTVYYCLVKVKVTLVVRYRTVHAVVIIVELKTVIINV